MNELLEPFDQLLDGICQPAAVRGAERGDDAGAAWQALCDSGYLDAMLPEDRGGAGLSPSTVAPLFIACGRHLLPHPFSETLVARTLASAASKTLPVDGPIVLWPEDDSGNLRSLLPPAAGTATHALVQRGSSILLRPLMQSQPALDGYNIGVAVLDSDAPPVVEFDLPEQIVMNWAAALTAASMAGAMSQVLHMTLQHVNHRQQFDRPLAKFQAVQQQVSVMAQHVAAATVATCVAFSRGLPGPTVLDAAIGKTVADGAATLVTAVAHATHGAIGITAEHNLSLYTRRLKRWQASFGSAGYWTRLLGEARLGYSSGTTIDFLRTHAGSPTAGQRS